MKKYYLVYFLFLIINSDINAQSLKLNIGLGIKFFKTKTDYSLPSFTDYRFNGKYNFSKLAPILSLEYVKKQKSFELLFSSQPISTNAVINFDSAKISQTYREEGGINQFQFIVNHFFKIKTNENVSIKQFLGIGFGIGFNRPKEFYDSLTHKTILYSTSSPTDFIEFEQNNELLSKLSYSINIRTGTSFYKDSKEKLRILFMYNYGLNKIVQTNKIYKLTNNSYFNSSTSRGNSFSIFVCIPLYIINRT